MRDIHNLCGSISRYIVVKEGTPALLVCRQMNQEAARYEYSHTALTVPDTMYFPELIYVIQKSCSSAIQIVQLTLGMVSDLRLRMIDHKYRPLEAAWSPQETVKEVVSALKHIEVTMELTELDRTRNIENIKEALEDTESVAIALRHIFCNRELEVYGYLGVVTSREMCQFVI